MIAAASAVGISPSAITEAIQELEETRRHAADDAASRRHQGDLRRLCLPAALPEHPLGAHRRDRRRWARTDRGSQGTLSIGVTITVAGYFLAAPLGAVPPQLSGRGGHGPELDRSVIEKQLAQGQLDIGILLVSNLEHVDVLATVTLAKSRRRLWTATNHPLLSKARVTLRDVAKEPYIQLLIDEAGEDHALLLVQAQADART